MGGRQILYNEVLYIQYSNSHNSAHSTVEESELRNIQTCPDHITGKEQSQDLNPHPFDSKACALSNKRLYICVAQISGYERKEESMV